MEQEPLVNSTWNQQELIKAIPAMIVGVSSVLFILGLLVVNLRLAASGIYSKEFLRTEYLLAGAVFVLFMVLAEISISHLLDWLDTIESHWREKQFSRSLLNPWNLAVALAPIPFVLVLFNGDPVATYRTLGTEILGVLFASVMLYSFISHVKSTFKDILPTKDNPTPQKALHKRFSGLLMPLLFMLASIGSYANATYPHISAAYGGGSRALATIFPTPRGKDVCKALSLPINTNQTVGPLEVLTESEKELTILVQNGLSGQKVAIQLNKELLDAIQTRSNIPIANSL